MRDFSRLGDLRRDIESGGSSRAYNKDVVSRVAGVRRLKIGFGFNGCQSAPVSIGVFSRCTFIGTVTAEL